MTDLIRSRQLAQQLRADSIRCTTAAGSGHPTSSMSAADLMAVLAMGHLRLDPMRPHDPANDRLIFSKGHASPLLYSLLKALGMIDDQDLMSLRTLDSPFEGHPTPKVPWVDAATGSLGQGLAIGEGIAWSASTLEHSPARVWVLIGDSETAEGSLWEAFSSASFLKLANLVAIIDVNRLGQRGQTQLGWHTDIYADRARAFGWDALIIDGHDHTAIDDAYRQALRATRPVCIVAKTVKGSGVSFLANQDGWHGKALSEDEAKRALEELQPPTPPLLVQAHPPEAFVAEIPLGLAEYVAPTFETSTPVATRKAFGEALQALGASRSEIVVLDAEVANSTHTDLFAKAFPERFLEMYIAEQAMLGVAQGISTRHFVVFASTFASFFTRAHDQLRMAAISMADLRLCGSHCGVSIGEDGPSQMALEDLGMFRALHGSTVLYPADAVATAGLVLAMAERTGICYLRTTREKTPIIYPPHEEFPIGGCKIHRSSANDVATIIAAGITVHEALEAATRLAEESIPVRVLDLYSVKPVDSASLRQCADDTGHFVIVEDHRPEGGIGEAVLSALAGDRATMPFITHLAVRAMPGSATPQQQLDRHGLSAAHIMQAVRNSAPTVPGMHQSTGSRPSEARASRPTSRPASGRSRQRE